MATIIIPTPLRKFTNNSSRLEVRAGNVQDTIEQLTTNFPDLKKHLLDDKGQVRSFVNIFIGNDDIRNLQQENTLVKDDTVISIIPAIAGGLISQYDVSQSSLVIGSIKKINHEF